VYVCVLGFVGILVYVSRSERVKNDRQTEYSGHLLKKTQRHLLDNHDPDEDLVQIQE
jgi:hypothetical protein